MTKQRVILFLAVALFLPLATWVLIKVASGYRPDLEDKTIKVTGLLSATSYPEGAQVLIDNQLQTATDDTLNLEPGSYEVEIKKDGFISWKKLLEVEKELVTETQARLFPALPELRPITTIGTEHPRLSPNGSRLAYLVPESTESAVVKGKKGELEKAKTGVWLMELSNLPLGFNQEPKQLVVSWPAGRENQESQLLWSYDSRQLVWVFPESKSEELKSIADLEKQLEEKTLGVRVYLVNTNETVEAAALTDITGQLNDLLQIWDDEREKQLAREMKKLPEGAQGVFEEATGQWQWSPDESKVLYLATDSAELKEGLIPAVPASSTQKQERNLEAGGIYVYDLKEDRNFRVASKPVEILTETPSYLQIADWWVIDDGAATIGWFPSSRHLVKVEAGGKISMIEYDGTNESVVYSGPLTENFAVPHPSGNSLILLTVLNPEASPVANLYSLNLR